MATLVLRSAGAAIGTALGGPIGGLIGGALGAVGGAVVDSLLTNTLPPRKAKPAQLETISITAATEGAAIRKLWGRMRFGGNVIWCAPFSSYVTTETTRSGSRGKGGGGAASAGQSTTTTTTHYTLSFAVAFCEGSDTIYLSRVWADGNPMDLGQVAHIFYPGNEGQLPDSWIETIEGGGNVPAFRGTCYMVFPNLDLGPYGNRMPQITAEIVRRPPNPDPNDLTHTLSGVALLPGAGEFALGTTVVKSTDGQGNWRPENAHTMNGGTDFGLSLFELENTLPAFEAVSLVISWFGSDLRAGECRITPKVDSASKSTAPYAWSVAGLTRASAPVTSVVDPALLDPQNLSGMTTSLGAAVAAYGGTPSDASVVEAIQAIHAQGRRVMFSPFVMMDIPGNNGLPDPYGGGQQVPYPWRGRITCMPAPGHPGTPDGTAAAQGQIDSFMNQFGPMVRHYVDLCASAGGVEAFVIGSELVGLTQVRTDRTTYPAIPHLKGLAAYARSVLGPNCKIGYAADWSEYHSHKVPDGSGDINFNMDPLWSDPNIDFVGIDNYLPVADWRDGAQNRDSDPVNGPFTTYDKGYLASNIEGGEDFDWYYASRADRVAQRRTPIVDTAYGEHWVFRQKDIRSWWGNPHVSRPGGVHGAASAWVPQGKPIWFTEFGCPAVDKGPNEPNVFYDPKSAESSLPWFSRGSKDDAVQRAYLEATLSYWRDHAPVSAAYSGPMVSTRNMFAWAWDARPYPAFPGLSSVWHDTPNYELGHWLTGRAGQVPLAAVIAELCAAVGVSSFDTSELQGPATLVQGYATAEVASPRDILAGLMDAYQFDVRETRGVLRFFSKANVRVTPLTDADFVVDGAADPGYSVTRAGDTDLPGAVRVSFADPFRAYATAGVEFRRATGNSQNVASVATAAVLDPAYASDVAAAVLQQTWAARETGTIKVPPSRLALDAGDAVTLAIDGVALPFRIRAIETTTYRTLDLVGFDPSLLTVASPPASRPSPPVPAAFGTPVVAFIELPPVTGQEPEPWAPRVAAYASPWAGVDVFRADGDGGWSFVTAVPAPTPMGELTSPLYSGPVDRWDRGNGVYLRFYGPANLLSLGEAQVLGGAGALAVQNPDGGWEVLQYETATLTGENSYALTKLLRGQQGTEGAMRDPVPAGARVVALGTGTTVPLDTALDSRTLAQTLRFGPSLYPVSDPSYAEATITGDPVGLRPFSVSQVEGRRLPDGDVAITWVRRTRFGGDSWDPPSVPLNEDTEAYDLEVLKDGAVVRAATGLPSANWTYPADAQAADFGAPQGSYTVRVYQDSVLYGRGQAVTRTVYL